jgi:hypothetical protein
LLPPPPLRTVLATQRRTRLKPSKDAVKHPLTQSSIGFLACPVPCALRLIGCAHASPLKHYRVNWTILISSRFRIASVEAHQFGLSPSPPYVLPASNGSTYALVPEDPAEVCPLSRAVILSFDATAIHLITSWLSLSRHSYTCCASSLSCEYPHCALARSERIRLTTFHILISAGRVSSLRRWRVIYGMRVASASACPLAFWLKPCAPFRARLSFVRPITFGLSQ